jgi:hypothetical protein
MPVPSGTSKPCLMRCCPRRWRIVAVDLCPSLSTTRGCGKPASASRPLSGSAIRSRRPSASICNQWGLRFLQASLLLPLHRKHNVNARAVPVRFVAAPSLKKPGAKATAQEQARFREQRKQYNLSQQSVSLLIGLRRSLDQAGAAHKRLLVAGDGSFCNRALFRTPLDRIDWLCRTRADLRLCHPAAAGSRRPYEEEKFTPEQVRQKESIAWQSTKLWQGGKRRPLRYKEINLVLWQSGAGRRPLRLLVVAPGPYRRTPRSR